MMAFAVGARFSTSQRRLLRRLKTKVTWTGVSTAVAVRPIHPAAVRHSLTRRARASGCSLSLALSHVAA